MFKKRILVLGLLIVLATLIYHAKSYTMAKVESPAEISVTTSDNALIAVPEHLKLAVDMHTTEDITIELTDSGETEVARIVEISYVASDNNLQIRNNMNETIDVEVKMNGDYKGIHIINDSCTLAPGRAMKNITVELDENIKEIPDSIDIKIYAEWQGGTAIIDNKLYLTVNNVEPLINVNTIDLRTPVQEAATLNVEEVFDENIDNMENEADFNQEITEADAIEILNDIDGSMSEDNPAEVNNKITDENLNNSQDDMDDIKPADSEQSAANKQE